MVVLDNGRPVLAASGGHISRFTETLEWGHALARTPTGLPAGASYRDLWNAKGWKELVENLPEHKQATTAILLENCRSMFGRLDEATRTGNLGTFDKWIFPVLSNMSENDVIDQLVSLQPMPGPVSQVVYMNIVTDKAKGKVPAGSPFWRANQGAVDRFNDSDEIVEEESLGDVTGGSASGTLAWKPVRAGTVSIAIDGVETTDDGNGAIVASGLVTGGTIVYATGAISITSSQNGEEALVTYAYDSEGNNDIMGYEMSLSSSPVTAKVIKLKAVWSEEANQNLQSMYNIKAEPTLLNAITNGLQYQKHRQVIYDLRAAADAGYVTWDANTPAGVNYQTHKYSVIDALTTASNFILGATNMASGNWILAGLQLATVLQTLPQFVSKMKVQSQGVSYAGDLGQFKVFVDPHYPNDEFLVGHKGDQFLTTGYVLAEYQKLYTTPDIMLPNFLHQRGFATSFAKKMINSKFYCRGKLINAPVNFA